MQRVGDPFSATGSRRGTLYFSDWIQNRLPSRGSHPMSLSVDLWYHPAQKRIDRGWYSTSAVFWMSLDVAVIYLFLRAARLLAIRGLYKQGRGRAESQPLSSVGVCGAELVTGGLGWIHSRPGVVGIERVNVCDREFLGQSTVLLGIVGCYIRP